MNNDIKSLWRSLPLSDANDLAKMDQQIDQRPQTWKAVAEFLIANDLCALPLGRNEIGEGAFANVQEYDTKLQSKYELHRRYIDVQLLARGEEQVFVADKENGREQQGEFDVDNDFVLFATADEARAVRVAPDSYLILYPSDAHMPCMAIGEPQPVRKVVVKIPYAE